MWISNLNIIPTVSNLPGQGSSGPAPPVAACLIELESGLGFIELESGLGSIELQTCPVNLIAQNNDNLIAQNNDQLITQ